MARKRRRYRLKEGLFGDILFIIWALLDFVVFLLKISIQFVIIAIKAVIEGSIEGMQKSIEEHKCGELTEQEATERLRTLVGYTENKLYYQVVKTEFPGLNRIREYVNFFTYDRETVAFENANVLVNKILNNVLSVYKGKSKKLYNTIVLEDYACDMKDLSRNLTNKLEVGEITMLMS